MALFTPALHQALDDDGAPISGAKWFFYLTESTTPTNVYEESTLETSLGSSVEADADGRFPVIYTDDDVATRAILKDAGGTTITDIALYDVSASAAVMPAGLFTDIGSLEIPVGVDVIVTSGYDTLGQGIAHYYVGALDDAAADETAMSTNSANGRPVYLAEDRVSLKQVGATANNLAADAARVQYLYDNSNVGTTIVAPMGPNGGAYKTTSASLEIDRLLGLVNDQGTVFRADNANGEEYSALRVNPVMDLNGDGFFHEITGYFSGNSLVIMTNPGSVTLFNGSGLTATGLPSGTHLAADVTTGTGTFAVQVNGANQTINLGSSGAPLTIGVIFNETRHFLIDGGTYTTNALSGTGGGYGLAVGDAAGNRVFSNIGMTVQNVTAGGNLGGIYCKGGLGRELQWFAVLRSTVEGWKVEDGSDGIIARDCILTEYVYFDLLEGAFHDGIYAGTAVLQNGIKVYNGSRLKFHDVQMEQSGVSAATPKAAMVQVLGTDFPSIGSEFIGNNYGGGTNYRPHIALWKARGTVIDRGYFNVCYETDGVTQAADIFLDRDATNDAGSSLPYLTAHDYDTAYVGSWDAYDTIIGYYNRTRGARTRQTMAQYTDVSRLLKFDVDSAAVRMPHRGLWYPAGDILTSLNGDLSVHNDGCQLMIEHSGRIAGIGGFTIAGDIAIGEAMFTIPEWMRPFVDAYATAIAYGASGDITVSLRIESTTGVVTLGTALVVADHTQLRIDPMSWMAVTDPYPCVGP